MSKTATIALLFLAAAFLAFVTKAWALDYSQPVKTIEGDVQEVCVKADDAGTKCLEKKPLTVGRVIATVLLTRDEKDKTTDPVELAQRGLLAEKILSGKEPFDLQAEDVVRIKAGLGKSSYNPFVIAQVLKAIDPGAITAKPVKTEDVKPEASQ